MSSDLCVGEDVSELIKDIISKNNWKNVSDIKYYPGSEAGDGYASRTIAVDVIKENDSKHMFLKCALRLNSQDAHPFHEVYQNEIYFYEQVYPAYLGFLKQKNVEDGFRNAPKCFGTSTKDIVVLENLKKLGFTLHKGEVMNENHITLILKTFAKFHAVSYALKDQRRQTYDSLAENAFDFMGSKGNAFAIMMRNLIGGVLIGLDPQKDKDILDICDVDDLVGAMENVQKHLNEYSILIQGDSWSNNMMFLYEGSDINNPLDIMLIDWQLLKRASPVIDLSYFFYSVATAKSLGKLSYYLKMYHEELSRQIRRLGSDPEVLYPFPVLQKEWKQYCKYGFAAAFLLIKVMLSTKEEIVNLEDIDMDNQPPDMFSKKMKRHEEYVSRIRILSEFMKNNEYL